ncbi:MAG TPA: chromate transporter [Myxococcales bacterium]
MAAGSHWAPKVFAGGGHAAKASGEHAEALIDDHTPTPPHARHSRRRLAITAAAFIAVGLGSFAAIAAAFGAASDFASMARFFTQAALLTFGGAYAVLPYVIDGAVDTFGWATAPQMIDGLALGETTPGPLIMIVAFVGFVGGWSKALLGPDALFLAGALGASVATFFTFLPSFLFILAGGPMVEASRGMARFVAPLTAVTAAVVGVIVNLSLFFGYHVLWPRGWGGGLDVPSAIVIAAATYALVVRKVGIIPVIVASAVAGLALRAATGWAP